MLPLRFLVRPIERGRVAVLLRHPPREKNRRATDDDQSNDATLSAVWPAIFTPFVYPPNVYNPPFRHKPATHCDRIRCSSPLCPHIPSPVSRRITHKHNLRGLDASSVVPPLCFVERLHPARRRRAPFRAAYVGRHHTVYSPQECILWSRVCRFFTSAFLRPNQRHTHTHTTWKKIKICCALKFFDRDDTRDDGPAAT